jgi:hypothetical protein
MGLKSILATMAAIAARDPAQLQPWRRDYTLGPVPNRYKPRQGKREMARRVRQLRRGIIQ